MFKVGGSDQSLARFLTALGKTHSYGGRVESWYLGEKITEVAYESGSVKVSGRNRERRSINDLKIAEKLWPSLPTDPLSPFGQWVQIYVDIAAGLTQYRSIPVFAGKAMTNDRDRWSGYVAVEAVDPMWQVNREPFESLRPAPVGARIVDTILAFLLEVFPEATLDDQIGSAAAIPDGVTGWNAEAGSRGKAIDELAAALGGEVFALPTAVWPRAEFVLRRVPSLYDPVAWELPDGEASVLVADKLVQSGAAVVNRWIVQVERADGPSLAVPVTDDNPASPTRYGGPMGRCTDFYSNQQIETEEQGLAAGLAKLARSIGIARPRTVKVISNPALEAGDVMRIGVDGEPPLNYIADDFDVPLQYDPPDMSIATRSTGDTA